MFVFPSRVVTGVFVLQLTRSDRVERQRPSPQRNRLNPFRSYARYKRSVLSDPFLLMSSLWCYCTFRARLDEWISSLYCRLFLVFHCCNPYSKHCSNNKKETQCSFTISMLYAVPNEAPTEIPWKINTAGTRYADRNIVFERVTLVIKQGLPCLLFVLVARLKDAVQGAWAKLSKTNDRTTSRLKDDHWRSEPNRQEGIKWFTCHLFHLVKDIYSFPIFAPFCHARSCSIWDFYVFISLGRLEYAAVACD